jgi:hypothetical protein
MSKGFSGTGEMQTEPDPDSPSSAGLSRTTTARTTTLILNPGHPSGQDYTRGSDGQCAINPDKSGYRQAPCQDFTFPISAGKARKHTRSNSSRGLASRHQSYDFRLYFDYTPTLKLKHEPEGIRYLLNLPHVRVVVFDGGIHH